MRTILFLLAFGSIAQADSNAVQAAKMPPERIKRLVRIKDLPFDQPVKAYADALVMDKNGANWLNANYVIMPLDRADLTITRSAAGYNVRVDYHYRRVNGYPVPVISKWPTGYAAPNFIAIKATEIARPNVRFAVSRPQLSENSNAHVRTCLPDVRTIAPNSGANPRSNGLVPAPTPGFVD